MANAKKCDGCGKFYTPVPFAQATLQLRREGLIRTFRLDIKALELEQVRGDGPWIPTAEPDLCNKCVARILDVAPRED
jgi:hypothetical protein